MKKTKVALLAAVLVVWLVASWIIPAWLRLGSSDAILLRIALVTLGIAGAAAFLWWNWRASNPASSQSSIADDLDLAFFEASAKLKKGNVPKARVSALPVILMLGDAGSAKTTVVLRSGLDPELLAGQAFSGETVGPTRSMNIWIARGSVVLDPASSVIDERASLLRVAGQLAPPTLRSRGAQPRAAVVCIDCEDFLKPGAAETLAAKARKIREQLANLSTALGIGLPVYVLFTKMDRLPYFFEYTAYLDDDEARQVFGTTLAFEPVSTPGVYAERQTERISDAFSALQASLCDRRLLHLAREHDPAKLPNIYEFPRNFRKIRRLTIEFLIDLCRPSQLQVSPVLRGFYFTGVRPVTVRDIVAVPPIPATGAQVVETGATRLFREPRQPMPEPRQQTPRAHRVPQWVYLGRLFPDVILADLSAPEFSKTSVKTSRAQRTVLVAASVLGLVLAAGWTASFLANFRLSSNALNAARAAGSAQLNGSLASVPALQRLAAARTTIEVLSDYETNGAPMYMRLGLFTGHNLYDPAYRSWFLAFNRLLLSPTRSELAKVLSAPQASSNGNYRSIYDALKAYLISTANPDKNPDRKPSEFLAPVLVEHWRSGKSLPNEQLTAATSEFEFYSEELRHRRPWPYVSRPDEPVVDAARTYLNKLSAIDSLYESIIARADQVPPLIFNRLYSGSDHVVINSYPVPAAATKAGWGAIQNSIQHVSDYFKGEEWVLGPEAFANVDTARLQQDLQHRYKSDFLKYWREYLRRTSVVRFVSIKDAAEKLTALSGNQSPLLEALCVVVDNTSVDPAIVDVVQPPRLLTPQGCKDRLSSPANDGYMQALIAMQASLSTLSTEESNDTLRADALSKATAAEVVVQQIARNFTVDKEHVIDSQTRNLIEAPIKYVQTLIAGVPKQEANAAAHGFCSQFNAVMKEYPFAPSSHQVATLKDVAGIFAPNEGALWKLYQDSLQKSLILSGNRFSPRPGANPQPNVAFTYFMNRAAAVSDAFYHGSPQPQLSFTLRVVNPNQDVQSVALSINGQTLNYSSANQASQAFAWPGTGPEGVKMRVKFAGGSEFDYPAYSGAWSVFRFFADAERWQEKGNEYTMERPLRTTGGVVTVPATGRPASVQFALNMGDAPPILKPGYFSGLVCVPVAIN